MSDFFAFWPSSADGEHTGSRTVLSGALGGNSEVFDVGRSWVSVLSTPNSQILLHRVANEGWLVVKGAMLDMASVDGRWVPHEIWIEFLGGTLDPKRYEGAFAFAAWNDLSCEGIAFNDQASVIHEYVASSESGCYVASSAISMAKNINASLCPVGTREFLVRGCVTGERSLFDGIRRLGLGENIRFRNHQLTSCCHWEPYQQPENYQDVHEAAVAIAAKVTDLTRRFAAVSGPIVADLTGGYDSRLLASACAFGGVLSRVTVNGAPEVVEDAKLSLMTAKRAGWDMIHFDPNREFTAPIDDTMRCDLTLATDGGLTFDSVFHHQFTRPQLAQGGCGIHFIGVGGEFTRYHAWQQEFLGIGRRRPANISSLLKYRYFTGSQFPLDLMTGDWIARCKKDMGESVKKICELGAGTLTTQQLDAAHVWKMTGHSSLYVSALHRWLTTAAPLMSRSFIDACIAVPWKLRLTSGLQRRIIYLLCPLAAKTQTTYGASATPVMPSTFHQHAWQAIRRFRHMAEKVTRVAINRNVGPQRADLAVVKYDSPDFRAFVEPSQMVSRALYRSEPFSQLMTAPERWSGQKSMVARMATIEQICREVNCQPSAGLLD